MAQSTVRLRKHDGHVALVTDATTGAQCLVHRLTGETAALPPGQHAWA